VVELSQARFAIDLNTGGEPKATAEAGAVTVRFTAACAAPAPVVHRFPGGCVTISPEPDSGPPDTLMRQAEQAVTFQTRDALREALRRRSDGRLQLDP
jgi:hypothetical protein